MSVEAITATRLAAKGLRLIDKVLTIFEEMAEAGQEKQLLGHTKNITDAVLACTKVQAEEREQVAFERENDIGDLRRLLIEHLAAMSDAERGSIIAEAAKGKKAA